MGRLKLDGNEFDELFGLTKEQKLAVRSLKRALNKCYDTGIFIHNEYGTLMPFNRKYIADITDIEGDPIINSELGCRIESKYDLCSWADDQHYVHLTQEGKQKLNRILFKEPEAGR